MSYLGSMCRYLPFRSCGCLLRLSKTRLPSLAKAAFVGANTVRPSPGEIQSWSLHTRKACYRGNVVERGIISCTIPCRAPASPADWTLDSRVLRSLLPATRSTILPCGGIITVSITCTIPLEAVRSKWVILDPSTVTTYRWKDPNYFESMLTVKS